MVALTQEEYDALRDELFPPPADPPTITGFSPASGPVGTTLSISGTWLDGATGVSFNGVSASFSVMSDTRIDATVPSGATTGVIQVTTPGGADTSDTAFVVTTGSGPTITSFSPGRGGPGTSVTIKGSGFSGATSVTFNGVSAVYKLKGGSQVTATVPEGASTGPIAVTTPNGTASSATVFVVPAAPAISGFAPVSGPAGTTVTIAGANLTDATAVKFGNSNAKFSVTSATSITATVPKGAKTGPISVTTPAGTATSSGVFTITR